MWFLIISATILYGLYLIHYYFLRAGFANSKHIDEIPGPPGWPVIGNLFMFLAPYEKLWSIVRKMNQDYYPIFKVLTPHVVVINFCHPDDVEVLLTSVTNIEKSLVYDILHPWFGTGLLTSTGTKWQQRRKILTPAFHFNVLQKYMEIIAENDERTIGQLKNQGEITVDLVQFLTSYTLNVICEAAMGTKLEGRKDVFKKYRKAIHDMGVVLVYRLVRPWLKWEALFTRSEKGQMQQEALKVIHGFSTQIIDERKKYHEQTEGKFLNLRSSTNDVDDDKEDVQVFGIRKRRMAMLDLLVAANMDGNKIDYAGIREEVDTFMFEGHDTSAMAMCFALLLLAEHKDAQTRCRAEVNELLEETGGKLGISELQRLTYLEMCIKESLRLYPSVPFISRKVTHDLQLKKYRVPKGTIAHLHVYEVHRDPNFWSEPEKFIPERFLPENRKDQHPFSYIPFSAGPRNCIGQKFAMMELKSLTAHLLSNFHFEPIDIADKVPIVCDLVLRPARPIHMKLVPIKK